MEVLEDVILERTKKVISNEVINCAFGEVVTEKRRRSIEEALQEVRDGKVTRIHTPKNYGNR